MLPLSSLRDIVPSMQADAEASKRDSGDFQRAWVVFVAPCLLKVVGYVAGYDKGVGGLR